MLAVGGDVLAALRPPFTVGALLLEVEGTAGAALCPQGIPLGGVHLHARLLALGAVSTGRVPRCCCSGQRWRCYSPERLALVADLRAAVDGDGLELHYQPQADLGTGVVDGVEALLRWRHPVRGLLSPDEFLPLAERTGLIRGLTLGVLAEAVAQIAAWHRAGHTFTVSVNLSARNLTDPTLPSEVAAMLRTAELDPGALVLEITESTVMADVGRALTVLRELRDLGVQVAVDDFGTGHSSLAYLQELPVDELKVDRSFVLASGDGKGAAIIAAVVELGHALGLRIVAEGIEDVATWDRLRDLGCDLGQGYLLSRPLPPEQLEAWLCEHRAAVALAPLATRR